MKTIEIVGKNYVGHYESTRVACRGIDEKKRGLYEREYTVLTELLSEEA